MSNNNNNTYPVMLCLRCGYTNKKKQGPYDYTKADKEHQRRCDFHMTVRYRSCLTGAIVGGARRGWDTRR